MPDWGSGGKGAVGGALAGGSVGGPIGAGIGAAIGGGLGLLGGGGESDDEKRYRQQLDQYYQSVMGRAPAQAGPAAQSGYSSFRTNQSKLIGNLENMAAGRGPSLAAQQFQQATDRNVATQQGLAASGRGGPLAAFNAAGNSAMLGAQAAQGSAAARTQEQQMALNQLGLTLHGARGADEQNNQFNANEQNQTSLANLDARLKSMQIDDNTRLQILQQMGGLNATQAARPDFGDQLMAGGAGMFSQGMAMGKKPGGTGRWANGQTSLYGL